MRTVKKKLYKWKHIENEFSTSKYKLWKFHIGGMRNANAFASEKMIYGIVWLHENLINAQRLNYNDSLQLSFFFIEAS